VNGEVSTTVSCSRKVNIGNYESVDVFVSMTVTPDMTVDDMQKLLATNACAYELAFEELERRVMDIKNPPKEEPVKREYGEAPAQVKPFDTSVTRIAKELKFSFDDVEEFNTVCSELGKDPVTAFLCAYEVGCKTYDQFIRNATTGERPPNAKPRLAVAK